MRWPLRHVLGLSAVLLLAAGLLVQGCHEDVGMTTGPDITAAVVMRTLKVSGGGNGNGHVTAPPTAGTAALDCPIVAATWNPIDCTKAYPKNTVVVLTAVPDRGFTFKEWTGPCTGTAPTCSVTMSIARSVKARFQGPKVPRFQVNITGGGDGGGTVTSQATLAPNIACTLNAGTASGTCSRTYPSGTSLILTASATSGHTFDGWSGACTGNGSCNLSVTTNRSVTANFSTPQGPEATFGRWASPQSIPVIALHLSLLTSGNALLWGHGGEPQLMNMGGGGFTQVSNQTCTNPATCELFCSGHTFLADGRLLVAGGHNEASGDGNGIKQASTFNGSTWQATGSMAYGRWYPTLVTLENGDVVALAGSQTPSLNASIPERYNGSTWTPLVGANLGLPLYPRAFVEPKNGHVFVAGEGTVRILNPAGIGSWSTGPARIVSDRSYGSAVMLDSKVLYAGGGGGGCPGTPQASAEIIDLAAPSPTWTATGSMAIGRRQTNLTVLPDGKVLMTGGGSQCGFTNETGAVFAAEMWDPAAGTNGAWTTLASAGVVRVYHSTTALLPDGRVLSTGSGDGGGVTQQFTYEIFSPPYLFKGPRPTYNLASTSMHYGQSFTVATPNAAAIRKVTLIRLASSTHAFDMGQRLNTLTFQAAADGQSLALTPPSTGRIAPPGPYMLFILNDRGVPSVAQTILLSQ
jgi:galactose oxidase-like protein/List-Bact-rpt repeat protein